jgi:hypothetical protein
VSWCDKLASTPTIGLRFDYRYASGASLIDHMAPLLGRHVSSDKQRFSIEKMDAISVTIGTEEGFSYSVDPTKIVVTFGHRIRVKPSSAGLPVGELVSSTKPFTKMLPEVRDRLVDLLSMLPKVEDRKLLRIGIVSNSRVDDDDMPPGIRRFVEYMARPWAGSAEQYTLSLLSELNDQAGRKERCFHQLQKTEDPDQLIGMTFDWQRLFDPPRPVVLSSMRDMIDQAADVALDYFEDIGQGNRFDEQLIRTAAQ